MRIGKYILKWLIDRLPADESDAAGWGPFRLPSPECDWMQRAAALHDYDFRQSAHSGQRLSDADAKLFYRWAMEAYRSPDPLVACRRMGHICKYWPIARAAGSLFWDSKK